MRLKAWKPPPPPPPSSLSRGLNRALKIITNNLLYTIDQL